MKLIVFFIFCLSIFSNFNKISAATETIQYAALIRVCENENHSAIASWLRTHYVKNDLPPNEINPDASFRIYNLTEASPTTTFIKILEEITVQIELKYLWASALIANKDSLEILQETFNIADSSEAVVFELLNIEEDNAFRQYVRVFTTNCMVTGIENPNYIYIPKCGKKCAPQIFIGIFRDMMKYNQKTKGESLFCTWLNFGIMDMYVMVTFAIFINAYVIWILSILIANYFKRATSFKYYY